MWKYTTLEVKRCSTNGRIT